MRYRAWTLTCRIHTCKYVRANPRTNIVCIHIFICPMYICIYMHVCIHTYTYTYTHTYIHLHISQKRATLHQQTHKHDRNTHLPSKHVRQIPLHKTHAHAHHAKKSPPQAKKIPKIFMYRSYICNSLLATRPLLKGPQALSCLGSPTRNALLRPKRECIICTYLYIHMVYMYIYIHVCI